jgi:transposase
MPAYKNPKKTRQYTDEFKAKAVKLTYLNGASVKGVAEALDIHPFHVVPLAQGVPGRQDCGG